MRTPLPVEDVAKIFEAEGGRFFWFYWHRVTAGRWDARLRFTQVIFPMSYTAKPVCDVLARGDEQGTRIWLNFGATGLVTMMLAAFSLFWALILSVFLYSLLFGDPQNLSWSDVGWMLFWPVAIYVVHKIGTRNADRDFARVVDLLQKQASAEIVPTPASP